MIASIERIMAYTSGLDFEQFQSDRKTVDAVVRNFEIIGEAASHVPAEIVADYSKIPWQDLPPLTAQLKKILNNQKSSQS